MRPAHENRFHHNKMIDIHKHDLCLYGQHQGHRRMSNGKCISWAKLPHPMPNFYVTWHKCQPKQHHVYRISLKPVCAKSRSQARVKWRIFYWCITFTPFAGLSFHLALVSVQHYKMCAAYHRASQLSKFLSVKLLLFPYLSI